ncbi:MAG: DUF1707 domain-containing protein [Streptosporangiaceae bacterium]|jgi:hypothetical protein
MTDRPILASDKERDGVVDVLRDAYTDGRLTLDEFEERTAAAYAARTWTDLRELTGDLPIEPMLGDGLPLRNRHSEDAVPGIVPAGGEPRRARRERPLGMLLPIVFVWIMVSAAAGSPDTAAALSVVFICLLACRIGYGGR